MSHVTDARLRSPEVARRLGIGADDVYRLIFAGDLDGRPDRDGIVYVSEASVVAYITAHRRVDSGVDQSDGERSVFVPAPERLPDFLADPIEAGGTGRDEAAPPEAETPADAVRKGARRHQPGRGPSAS